MQFVYSQFHQKTCAIITRVYTLRNQFRFFRRTCPGSNLYILKFRPALQLFRPVCTSILPRKQYSNLCSACWASATQQNMSPYGRHFYTNFHVPIQLLNQQYLNKCWLSENFNVAKVVYDIAYRIPMWQMFSISSYFVSVCPVTGSHPSPFLQIMEYFAGLYCSKT